MSVDRCMLFCQHAIGLNFKSSVAENDFLKQLALGRVPSLTWLASFDLLIFLVRLGISIVLTPPSHIELGPLTFQCVSKLLELLLLYAALFTIFKHSCKSGAAAKQGELSLATLIATVLSRLILQPSHGVYVSFFIIATPTLLRLRWFVGAVAMAVPVLVAFYQAINQQQQNDHHITADVSNSSMLQHSMLINGEASQALMHLVVAWAVSTLMGFLADSSRRIAYANERLARASAATELNHARELAAAQALAEARSMLVEQEKSANEAKSEFISMLCHEIRTPLNGCLASAEMLLQTPLDSDQTELANTVRVSGSILLSTVSNFLDYFKLEAGKPLDVVQTPLDLATMVGDVHRIMQAMVTSGSGVELLLPDLRGAPRTALGDPARLCGILLNMYMNAAKFTKRGSIQLTVHAVPANYRPSPVTAEKRHVASSPFAAAAAAPAAADDISSPPSRTSSLPMPSGRNSPSHANAGSAQRKSTTVPRMLVQDEGSGWVSTCSESPWEYTECTVGNAQTPHTTPASNNENSADADAAAAAAATYENNDAQEHVQWVCFEVADTGCGVPHRSLQALFHNYVQGDDAEVAKPRTRSGTGLGLAICGKQVSFMGGVIGALTKQDAGSIFWFKVPMPVDPSSYPSPSDAAFEAYADAQQPTAHAAAAAAAASTPAVTFNHVQHEDGTVSIALNTPTPQSQGQIAAAAMAAGMRRSASYTSLSARLEQQWSANNLSEMANNNVDNGGNGNGSGALVTNPSGATAMPTAAASAAAALAAASPGCLSGYRVLVAEDNLINRKVACRVLQSLGVECEIASNGREAVEAVEAAAASGLRLDAVLMDCSMPVLGGMDATREIRNMNNKYANIPIVAMTANAMDKDRDACLAAGMDAFLSKPVLREQLQNCILEVCKNTRDCDGSGSEDSTEMNNGDDGGSASGSASGIEEYI